MQIMASRMKELREETGMSQKQAAQALFISNTSLSNYELNISTPSPETIVEICKLYGVSADYLFGITDTKYRVQSMPADEINLINLYLKLSSKEKKLILDIAKAIGSNKCE